MKKKSKVIKRAAGNVYRGNASMGTRLRVGWGIIWVNTVRIGIAFDRRNPHASLLSSAIVETRALAPTGWLRRV